MCRLGCAVTGTLERARGLPDLRTCGARESGARACDRGAAGGVSLRRARATRCTRCTTPSSGQLDVATACRRRAGGTEAQDARVVWALRSCKATDASATSALRRRSASLAGDAWTSRDTATATGRLRAPELAAGFRASERSRREVRPPRSPTRTRHPPRRDPRISHATDDGRSRTMVRTPRPPLERANAPARTRPESRALRCQPVHIARYCVRGPGARAWVAPRGGCAALALPRTRGEVRRSADGSPPEGLGATHESVPRGDLSAGEAAGWSGRSARSASVPRAPRTLCPTRVPGDAPGSRPS